LSPESDPDSDGVASRNYLCAGLICLVLGLACLPGDLALARWIGGHALPGDLRKMISYSEVFGHGLGVLWIVITAACLDRRGPQVARFLLALAFLPGLVAGLLKLVVGRSRPYACGPAVTELSQTFVGLFATLRGDTHSGLLDERIASLPSAHAATALGLALGLGWLYPRGRWLFLIFALLAGAQRCFSEAHFISDVIFGFAVACFLAAALIRPLIRWTGISRTDFA
jgi:membrane-associated phospholipid phosphatase